jgi:sugar lactone lactonase YvrE
VLYHVDTAARTLSRRDYGSDGTVGEPTVLVKIDGMPDGIAVDDGGGIWVTVFDQGRVDCYTPEGRLMPERSIVIADAHVASVGFAGADLDVLVIATGMPIMRGWQRLRRREDGYLFTLTTAARGIPAHPWHPVPLPQALPTR